MDYQNLVSCGNCHSIFPIEFSRYCEVCGMMICGDCGRFCKNHIPQIFEEKLVIFQKDEVTVGMSNIPEIEAIHSLCIHAGVYPVEILEFENFVFVGVEL